MVLPATNSSSDSENLNFDFFSPFFRTKRTCPRRELDDDLNVTIPVKIGGRDRKISRKRGLEKMVPRVAGYLAGNRRGSFAENARKAECVENFCRREIRNQDSKFLSRKQFRFSWHVLTNPNSSLVMGRARALPTHAFLPSTVPSFTESGKSTR